MKIDLISSSAKPYTFEAHAISQVHAALLKKNIQANIVSVGGSSFRHYLHSLVDDRPDLVITFSDPFPFETPVFEQMGIKHFYWNKGSIGHCLHYIDEPLARIGVIDRDVAESGSNLFFLPHACGNEAVSSPGEERPFDVAIFDPLVDTAHLEKTWQLLFPKEVCCLLHDVVDKLLKDPHLQPLDVLKECFGSHQESKLGAYLLSIEEYLKAKRNHQLIESLADVDVHVFGEHIGANWLKRLKNSKRVYLHWKLPYTAHFDVLKKSKAVIRTHAPSFQGSDEWAFAALQHGCMPLVTKTTYLGQQLPEEMLFTDCVDLAVLKKRSTLVTSLQEKIDEHRYLARVERLLAELAL